MGWISFVFLFLCFPFFPFTVLCVLLERVESQRGKGGYITSYRGGNRQENDQNTVLVGRGAEILRLIQSKQSSRRDSWGFSDPGHSLPLAKFELMAGFRHTKPMSFSAPSVYSVHFVRLWTE